MFSIGAGEQEPVFLDYVCEGGEFSHVSLNKYDEFVAAGSIQLLYGYVDAEGSVVLYSEDPVSDHIDRVYTDIADSGEFIATGHLETVIGSANPPGTRHRSDPFEGVCRGKSSLC
ncbi:MAG: hypothetical protein MZV49_13220 [Rhodopseudomonas palustris]|nr:hypothetical protein [Rhodopseudomonas palustris]